MILKLLCISRLILVEKWIFFLQPDPFFFGDDFVCLLWPFNGVLSQSINDFIPESQSSQLFSRSLFIMIHLIHQALKDWVFVYLIITNSIRQFLRNHKALSGCCINY